MVHQLWHQFPTTEIKLQSLQDYLLNSIDLPIKPIQSRVIKLFKSGGKLLRPGFFYLFSEFGDDQDTSALQAGAAAMEMLHVATLVHDDVIDQSDLRRGIKTIHKDFGQRNAIYAGDYLFTCYFNELLKTRPNTSELHTQVESMKRILTGELDQMNLRFNLKENPAQYLNEITGKTAELFKLSCAQGTILTHCDDSIVQLSEKIGQTIGQAYQIIDDILDYTGDSGKTKKPILEDLKTGVYTLPLIYALKINNKKLKPLLSKKDSLDIESIQEIQNIVITDGGLDAAKQKADELTQLALSLIKKLPNQQARDDIYSLTKMLLDRNN
ncbi:polyprenyl synthetase family protein [Lentilactobacillus sp. Marseille-Q4993]|uniref:polyprenyl synthetase family protein n=1 Tax=Lentilactobacillus sp. Marseille-Q4993 TaxID=3039492 RepID=UPI0024BC67B9|nr:polyprenyl synthetase family protein [Lentilactobacillus sp. Marseille-Q4993]